MQNLSYFKKTTKLSNALVCTLIFLLYGSDYSKVKRYGVFHLLRKCLTDPFQRILLRKHSLQDFHSCFEEKVADSQPEMLVRGSIVKN